MHTKVWETLIQTLCLTYNLDKQKTVEEKDKKIFRVVSGQLTVAWL